MLLLAGQKVYVQLNCLVITELQVPSIRWSLIAGMVYAARWCFSMNPELMNESKDPESTRDISGVSGIDSEVTGIMRVSGVVMEALRVTIVCALRSPWGGGGGGLEAA